jgi:alkylation response protein AidB-like acyl-CoA dehydrogenase
VSYAFSPEQDEFRLSLRRFLADKSPATEVRKLMEASLGYDRQVWKQMADQLGLQGLAIPEEFGGAGSTPVELGIAFEEMGRVLLCAPFFSTVGLAAQALLAAGDDQAKRAYLPRIADGSLLATVAVTEADGRWDLAAVRTAAVPDSDVTGATGSSGEPGTFRLDGTKMFVVDGHIAELLLVVAQTGSGLGLFAVDAFADGVIRTPLQTLDMTRKLARLEFTRVPARLVSGPGDATAALSRALDLALVALTSEQAGGAQRCLDMAVDYAKIRMQFGRPVGSFQAIKHKCAEMLIEVESARSAAYHAAGMAAEALNGGTDAGVAVAARDELGVAAAIAKAYCSEAYFHVAAETIQVHGGIGFTWEHDAHLYFRRAKSSQLMLGDEHHHRERFAALTWPARALSAS